MDCLYIALFYLSGTQSALQWFASHSPIHTLTHTYRGRRATMQGAALPIRSNLGFRVLLKDTSAHAWEESGIEPPTLRLTLTHQSMSLSFHHCPCPFCPSPCSSLSFSLPQSLSPTHSYIHVYLSLLLSLHASSHPPPVPCADSEPVRHV